ncbi:hypothetical protein UA08_05852 [Talaromyces atroroseus]|uniref:t-SNARE coiled-coil homology domain-containing protein n=1 Tax=Talaromyces atroroseus TaxID=1441469 RepID=A0A225AVT6_TALAT|nr:hypothetical protein UA08_05852 [Talaromyces atroroseus]OKL59076.1 hypothetical protein UA08_05852 [Talaromyces atroroseus]
MASRFHSSLHQRDPRSSSSLFDSYSGDNRASSSRPSSRSPNPSLNPYGYSSTNGQQYQQGYRTATPNSRGHYSDAVLDELESQNDHEVEGITAKVRALKDAESMNDAFDTTRLRLRGTMNRMLRMAERTGLVVLCDGDGIV